MGRQFEKTTSQGHICRFACMGDIGDGSSSSTLERDDVGVAIWSGKDIVPCSIGTRRVFSEKIREEQRSACTLFRNCFVGDERKAAWSGRELATLREEIEQAFPHDPVDLRTYSPLPLAFLGDAVYSMIVRTVVLSKGNRQAEKMHEETRQYVSAQAQARMAEAVQDLLTPEEMTVYRRGLHSNPHHFAKNQSAEDYLRATGLETLCGYLYLSDKMPRLLDLLRQGLETVRRSG